MLKLKFGINPMNIFIPFAMIRFKQGFCPGGSAFGNGMKRVKEAGFIISRAVCYLAAMQTTARDIHHGSCNIANIPVAKPAFQPVPGNRHPRRSYIFSSEISGELLCCFKRIGIIEKTCP